MKITRHITIVIIVWLFACACSRSAENPVVVGAARFTVITPGLIRMEYADSGAFIDERSLFAVDRHERWNNFTLEKSDHRIQIETPTMTVVYTPDGKKFSASNLSIKVKAAPNGVRWTPGMANTRNLGGTNRTLDGVADEVPIADGLLSRDGWYWHDDSRRPLLTGDWVTERPAKAGTDWYFFAYGVDYKQALKDLRSIAGGVPLPRKYALGSWYSRYWPYSSADYRQIVGEYAAHDFPLDVMVMDMDWHKDGWTGWSWNRTLLPDAEALLKWFHANGVAVTLNLHPADGVRPHEDQYAVFMKDMGVDPVQHPDSVIPFDAANQKYMRTLFRDTHDVLEDEGVDFWWLDWQQTEMTRSNPELKNLEWLNQLYFQQSERKGQRGISFSRWGGWGNHRYPINFSGDAGTRWPMLAFEVPFTTTAGNVGCFFWSHDIGGHMGGFFPETNCRWIQFGAVSAALRLHSTRDATMDKRPWIRDSIYTASQRIAFHLRSELFPYIYSSAWRTVTEMVPLTAPMYIDHSTDSIAYAVPQEYMFGPALLAAPVTTPGIGPKKVASQQVWFPSGTWFNWFTGERIEGANDLINVLADIDEFPLYAKAGMPVTLQPYRERMASAPLTEVIIRTFPGADGSASTAVLYEDDGISNEYEHGRHALTEIAYSRSGDRHEIHIRPTVGVFDGQLKERSYVVEFPCTKPVERATVNGREVTPEYDEHLLMNRIRTEKFPIDTDVVVQIVVPETDRSILQRRAAARRMSGIVGHTVPPNWQWNDASIAELKKQVPAGQLEMAIAFINGINLRVNKGRIELFKNADSKVGAKFTIGIEDRSPGRTRTILRRRFSLANGNRIAFPIIEPLVEDLGRTTARMLSLDYAIGAKQFAARETLSVRTSAIRQWNLVGPFAFDPRKGIADVAYEPERELVFDGTKSYFGLGARAVRWQTGVAGSDDVIDLGGLYKTNECVAYGFVYLYSDKRQTVTFHANSDDGIEMFLNGVKIFSNNVMRGVEASTDTVEGIVKPGANALLVKISQGSGGWGFRIRTESDAPLRSSTRLIK